MRWWYEAIVRGLGGWACDPTKGGCIYERKGGEGHQQAYERLCDACRLFGCTGWRRRFRLLSDIGSRPYGIKFCLATLDRPEKFNHWWLSKVFADVMKRPFLFTDVALNIQLLPGASSEATALRGLLSLMAHYGAIGAKPQYGFGQFDWTEKLSPSESLEAIRKQVGASTHRPGSRRGKDYYTLRNFWHIHCVVPETEPLIRRFEEASIIGDKSTFKRLRKKYLPVSFDLRYKLPGSRDMGLRQSYRLAHGKMAARKVFGTLKGDKLGSRVFVSHLYKRKSTDKHYNLNVWGFTSPNIGKEMSQQLLEMFPGAECESVTGSQLLKGEGEGK
jgi:CRISPR-associated protein Cmr1